MSTRDDDAPHGNRIKCNDDTNPMDKRRNTNDEHDKYTEHLIVYSKYFRFLWLRRFQIQWPEFNELYFKKINDFFDKTSSNIYFSIFFFRKKQRWTKLRDTFAAVLSKSDSIFCV